MMVGRKAKLAGVLESTRFQCECCSGLDMLVHTSEDNKETTHYCRPCFTNNCKCGGKNTAPVA